MAETRAAAEHADSVGPLGKAGGRKVDDATAALIIQRSWRGFLTRREQAELVKRLKKMRANVRSSPINPKEHRNLPVGQRMDLYLPRLASTNHREQLMAATFMNRITKNSPQFADDFIQRGGLSAVVSAASKLGRKFEDTSVQQELTPLLLTCLQRPSSKAEVEKNLEKLLEIFVNNVKCFKKNEAIMSACCEAVLLLAAHPNTPVLLKALQFPFHVAQCHRQFGPKTKSSLLAALKKADEAIRVADALPEH
ncbi:hypothetical protein M3Y99_00548800 [Aphelenchoides fujianensis]|nr:hypothetical protein M3Y99_00548800 [Aphelenchoides fujianensis]